MSEHTKIEWADHSWSPWRGCTKVSPGCSNCYAETLSKRNPAVLGQWGKGKPRVLAKNWRDPVRWNKRQKERSCGYCDFDEAEGDLLAQCPRCAVRPHVFPSLCDWLDEEVPIEWLVRFLQLIRDTPHLDWLLLTKRPELWESRSFEACRYLNDGKYEGGTASLLMWLMLWRHGQAPYNVWFGVSAEDHQRANQRIPLLLQIPAKLRWVSLEPLLGPVDLAEIENALTYYDGPQGVQWLVIGGESGAGARPCNISWIRQLKDVGRLAGIPVFVKQMGSNPFYLKAFSHPKGGDPSEWPIDMRVRQFPNTTPPPSPPTTNGRR